MVVLSCCMHGTAPPQADRTILDLRNELRWMEQGRKDAEARNKEEIERRRQVVPLCLRPMCAWLWGGVPWQVCDVSEDYVVQFTVAVVTRFFVDNGFTEGCPR